MILITWECLHVILNFNSILLESYNITSHPLGAGPHTWSRLPISSRGDWPVGGVALLCVYSLVNGMFVLSDVYGAADDDAVCGAADVGVCSGDPQTGRAHSRGPASESILGRW